MQNLQNIYNDAFTLFDILLSVIVLQKTRPLFGVFFFLSRLPNVKQCNMYFFSIHSLHIIFISGKWVTKLYTIEKSEAHRKILLIIRFNVLTKKHIPFLFVPILQTDTNIYLDKKRNKKRIERVVVGGNAYNSYVKIICITANNCISYCI